MPTMQCSGRVIKPNHSNALPRYIISLDTETMRVEIPERKKTFSQRFRLGVAISVRFDKGEQKARKVFRFNDPEKFWDWLYRLTKPNYTTWLVGHNLLFDLKEVGFAKQMTMGRISLDAPRKRRPKETDSELDAHSSGLCCIDAPPTIVGLRCSQTQGRIICVDTLNWFQEPLANLGNAIDLQKLAMPLPHDSALSWYEYCERDAEIVLQTFVKLMHWVKDNNMGMFRYTAAAQAMAAYRHRFMPYPIFVHDNMEVKELERESYYGGRTEVFKIGKIDCDVCQLDVSSLFPSIMRDETVPYKLDRFHLTEVWSDKLPDIRWQDSVAQVMLLVHKGEYPKRTKADIVYPRGCFRTTLCGKELWQAVANGEVVRVASWAEYQCGILFRDFVDTLWTLRQEYKATGNKLYDTFAKRILNSLYGKFGQKGQAWETRTDMIAPDPWISWLLYDAVTNTSVMHRTFGWQVQRKCGRGELVSSFPAISAFITAAARSRMNSLRRYAGPRNVFYQGVDSLIVNQVGLDNLTACNEVMDNALGKLRLQFRTNYGHIYGCNDYQLGTNVTIAGRAGNYVTIDDSLFMCRKFSAVIDMFDGRMSPDVLETEAFWQRRKQYSKGIVGSDNYVAPLELAEPLSVDGSPDNALSTIS